MRERKTLPTTSIMMSSVGSSFRQLTSSRRKAHFCKYLAFLLIILCTLLYLYNVVFPCNDDRHFYRHPLDDNIEEELFIDSFLKRKENVHLQSKEKERFVYDNFVTKAEITGLVNLFRQIGRYAHTHLKHANIHAYKHTYIDTY